MAKLSLSKEGLKKALDVVTATINNNSTVPILRGIKFQIQNNVLAVYTNSITAFSLSYLNVESDDNFCFAVEGILFADLIKRLRADKIELELDKSNLVIKAEGFKTVLPILEVNEFPDVPKVEGSEIKVNTDCFLRSINLTSLSCSREDMRPILKCIRFEGKGKKITTTALDGYRLATTNFSIKENVDEFAVNIPVVELTKVIKNIDEEKITLNIDTKLDYFTIKYGATICGVKLMEGDYINYEQIIPRKEDATSIIGLEIDALKNGLDLIGVFKKEAVRFDIGDTDVSLNCLSAKGQIKKELEIISKEGKNLEISFNPLFFDVLGQLDNYSDKIVMYFTEPIAPMVFEPLESGFAFTYLVLPIRTVNNSADKKTAGNTSDESVSETSEDSTGDVSKKSADDADDESTDDVSDESAVSASVA